MTIEPTEEQIKAASDIHGPHSPTVARLLARRLRNLEISAKEEMDKLVAQRDQALNDKELTRLAADSIDLDLEKSEERYEKLNEAFRKALHALEQSETKLARAEVAIAALTNERDQLVADLKDTGYSYPDSNTARFITHNREHSAGDWYDPVTRQIMYMDAAKAFKMRNDIEQLTKERNDAEEQVRVVGRGRGEDLARYVDDLALAGREQGVLTATIGKLWEHLDSIARAGVVQSMTIPMIAAVKSAVGDGSGLFYAGEKKEFDPRHNPRKWSND